MAAGVVINQQLGAVSIPAGAVGPMGFVGVATKGRTDELYEFTDASNFITELGRPVSGHYGPRAALRYLKRGNQLKYVRVAGTLLRFATVSVPQLVGSVIIPIITFTASSKGTWANDVVKIAISHNGSPATSYNVHVYFYDKLVESFTNLTNGNVETTINNNSNLITASLHINAGVTFPASTLSATTEQHVFLILSEGDDGAFASSKSEDSSSGGLAAQNSWSYALTPNTTVNYSNSEGRAMAPGSLVVATTTPVETFTDNEDGTLTGSATGTGFVDYDTGDWEVIFNGIPTANVTVAFDAGTLEVSGSTLAGTANYSGSLGRRGAVPDTLTFFNPRDDQLDLGDGATAAYTPTLGVNIVRDTVTITAIDTAGNTMTVSDNGAGVLTGDVTVPGTINYVTGACSWTFTANAGNTQPISGKFKQHVIDDGAGALSGDGGNVTGTINYQTGAWTLVNTLTPAGDFIPGMENGGEIQAIFKHCSVLGFGDTVETTFSGILEEYPVKPGSVSVQYSTTVSFSDDGNGNLTPSVGTGSGTVNYYTGAISVTYTTAPAALGFPVRATYDAIVLQVTCKYISVIGNERAVLTDGLYVWVDKSPSTPITTPFNRQWYRLRVFFNNGSGSAVVETFDLAKTISELVALVNDATNGSTLITLEETSSPGEIDISYGVGVGQKIGMAGAVTQADIIGSHVGAAYTGMQLFSNLETVALDFIAAPGIWHRQTQQAGIDMSSSRFAVWLYAMPNFDNPTDARDFVNGSYNAVSPGGIAVPTATVPYPPLALVDSDSAACFFSWLNYFDQYENADVWEPTTGHVAEIIGRHIADGSEPWIPTPNKNPLENTNSLRYSPSKAERALIGDLNGTQLEVVNSFVSFVNQGIFLYGQRTMTRISSPLDRLHVRWTFNNKIAIPFLVASRRFPHNLNDEVLWRRISSTARRILNPIAQQGGLTGYTIVCDGTVNTAALREQKKALCIIALKFPESMEELTYQFIYTPQSVEFSEVLPS